MGLQEEVIRCLASGQWCSGTAIAETLGVSRAAVWKHVRTLPELGLPVSATAGRGYRLRRPLDLLNARSIIGALDAPARLALDDLTVVPVTDSTSDDLIARPGPDVGRLRSRLAEFQSRGRGRRGRAWWSAYGSGLCMSVAVSLAQSPRDLPALSLAVGVVVRRVIAGFGGVGIVLKWPNDLLNSSGKVGGILVDVSGESGGPLKVVVGLGINLDAPEDIARGFEALPGQAAPAGPGLPAAGIEFAEGRAPSRNDLSAGLVSGIFAAMIHFGDSGFRPFLEEWRAHDFLRGKGVDVVTGHDARTGVACGVAEDGALLVETRSGIQSIVAGDVSVRPQ
jgi:BirA family biotin operon repressor/biotin-[acetyl-CoA-carboxylase] ligase